MSLRARFHKALQDFQFVEVSPEDKAHCKAQWAPFFVHSTKYFRQCPRARGFGPMGAYCERHALNTKAQDPADVEAAGIEALATAPTVPNAQPAPEATRFGLYRNKKTGKFYRVLGEVLDCTNSRDGTVSVLYRREEGPESDLRFVRERAEFQEKFERLVDAAQRESMNP